MITEQLKAGKITDENDPKIQEYVEDAKRTHGDDIQKFELWVEYLKRNDKFKKACEWFETAKREHPYPPELQECRHQVGCIEDYLVFSRNFDEIRSTSPLVPLKQNLPIIDGTRHNGAFRIMLEGSFFVWAVDAGYPEEYETETLMNLFVFGNLFNDPSQITLLRIMTLIQNRNKLYAMKTGDIIDAIFRHVETDSCFLDGRDPSFEEYKHQLKRLFDSDFFLNISLLDPYENKDKTIKAIKRLIDKRRSNLSKIDKEHFEFFKPDQFEWPTGKERKTELKHYLDVYDNQQKGVTNRELATQFYPGYDLKNADSSATALRYVSRDLQKAEKIIKNVEMGYFPGKYQ